MLRLAVLCSAATFARADENPFVDPDAQTCRTTTDCPVGNYCDGGPSCYECAFISPDSLDSCDAYDGDCCSAEFLKNCPSNPYGCVPCKDPKDFAAAMQSLSQKCCPSADACTDGMPTECSTECQETLDSVLGSCKKVLSAQPAAMQAKLTTFSQKCVDSNDIDNGDGYGDPDDYTPDQECAAVGDCPVGSYCDARPACYDCNFIDVADCDAVGGDCCSADFLKNCPANPAKCPAKIPCTSSSMYATAMGAVTSACCPTQAACPNGMPSDCTSACYDKVRIVVDSCPDQIKLQSQATQDSIARFHVDCKEQEQDRINNIDDPDGGDGYGPDDGVIYDTTCSVMSDCKGDIVTGESTYCDNNGGCYSCDFISEDTCDALGDDCCGADFLKACPNNPAKCEAHIPCADATMLAQAIAKIGTTCCPDPTSCTLGIPNTCSAACSKLVRQTSQSCSALILQQPETVQESLDNMHNQCADDDFARATANGD